MISKLLFALPLLLQAAGASNSAITDPPPIKMGLWEATLTTATGTTVKTRSCLTAESYQRQIAKLPPSCTLSNVSRSSTSISGDVSCTAPNGMSSSGHFQAQFPDTSTVHTTVSSTMTVQGRSMPMTITSDSHFVSADCGGIAPGESRTIR